MPVNADTTNNNMTPNNDVYERFNLYSLPEFFYLEPRDRNGSVASNHYLEIDRSLNTVQLKDSSEGPIPVAQAEQVEPIFGIVGVIDLVSGLHLVVIKRADLVGTINDAEIYHIAETAVIPFKKTTLHLNERQLWFNRHFVEMIQMVLATGGFYYSTSFDLSYSLQWLSENATPNFRHLPMIERANPRFVWNRRMCSFFSAHPELARFTLPIIHGFVGVRHCVIRGCAFKLMLISRRSTNRAGVRFHVRGSDKEGNSANFVETEQIVEFDKDHHRQSRCLTSFLQIRGSIPLYWSQRPNLRWQPLPSMKPADDQLEAYRNHMSTQHHYYPGKHVILNLINHYGREKKLGDELERVTLQAALDFVKYVAFDFHRQCSSLNWDRLVVLRDIIASDIRDFGFFHSALNNPLGGETAHQQGYFRTNCMDCLDRTNVVQALVAKETLRYQLIRLGIIDKNMPDLEFLPDFLHIFKNLWADNGDECSRQYSGTGALKTDYTRVGKRTVNGALQDGYNAVTRYFKNNFTDGYRQDAIDLFLGNYKVDPANLPARFECSVFNLNANGGAIAGAVFSAAMMVLCIIVSENLTATLFWMVIFSAFMAFIFLNGEEFVNAPKLKQD
ncbi:sacI homology domain-containing protein [Ditylenchus destructor]|nr:sacI homology domain-containing protein [Ditylenchus destructor]